MSANADNKRNKRRSTMKKINWNKPESTKLIADAVLKLASKAVEGKTLEEIAHANHAIIEQLAVSLSQHLGFTAALTGMTEYRLKHTIKDVMDGFEQATINNWREQKIIGRNILTKRSKQND